MCPNADSIEEVAAGIRRCPSGALQYHRKDGVEQEKPPRLNALWIRENGPLAILGNIMLDEEEIGYRATLCRCGMPKTKPFCDSSHTTKSFQNPDEPLKATGEVEITIKDENQDSPGGPLVISPQMNGPLQVSGNLQICSTSGTKIRNIKTAVLCRCGLSQNKPYCDDSHATSGFTT